MGAVVACEWSENCADLLEQEQPIHIHIDRVDEMVRRKRALILPESAE